MRRTTIAATLATGLAASLAWTQQSWMEYRPGGAGFRIEFPGQPTSNSRGTPEGASSRMTPLQCGELVLGREFYSACYSDLLVNPNANPDVLVNAARDGAIRGNPGSTLREDQRLMIGVMAARRFLVDVAPKNLTITYLVAAGGGRIYHVNWAGPTGRERAPEVQRFLASFTPVER